MQRKAELADELGGVAPLGGVTVIADGEGRVRHVVSRPLPTTANGGLDHLRGFVASVEHRMTAAAWGANPARRIVDHMNLQGIDSRK